MESDARSVELCQQVWLHGMTTLNVPSLYHMVRLGGGETDIIGKKSNFVRKQLVVYLGDNERK